MRCIRASRFSRFDFAACRNTRKRAARRNLFRFFNIACWRWRAEARNSQPLLENGRGSLRSWLASGISDSSKGWVSGLENVSDFNCPQGPRNVACRECTQDSNRLIDCELRVSVRLSPQRKKYVEIMEFGVRCVGLMPHAERDTYRWSNDSCIERRLGLRNGPRAV